MYRLIIVGSPNAHGRSAHLAYELFESCIDECPDDQVKIVSVASLHIEGCTGCDGCRDLVKKAKAQDAKRSSASDSANNDDTQADANVSAEPPTPACSKMCIIDDDMQEVYNAISAADEIIVVAPVYFAGPTSQLKALLDRLQPFFWSDARHEALKPATLHIIGEGHDPFGYDPLVTCVQSSLLCAGFELLNLFDWVGCINADGEITQEAQQYTLYIDEESDEYTDVMEADSAPSPQPKNKEVKLDLSGKKGRK